MCMQVCSCMCACRLPVRHTCMEPPLSAMSLLLWGLLLLPAFLLPLLCVWLWVLEGWAGEGATDTAVCMDGAGLLEKMEGAEGGACRVLVLCNDALPEGMSCCRSEGALLRAVDGRVCWLCVAARLDAACVWLDDGRVWLAVAVWLDAGCVWLAVAVWIDAGCVWLCVDVWLDAGCVWVMLPLEARGSAQGGDMGKKGEVVGLWLAVEGVAKGLLLVLCMLDRGAAA